MGRDPDKFMKSSNLTSEQGHSLLVCLYVPSQQVAVQVVLLVTFLLPHMHTNVTTLQSQTLVIWIPKKYVCTFKTREQSYLAIYLQTLSIKKAHWLFQTFPAKYEVSALMYTDFKRKLSQTLWSLLKHTNFIEKLIHILCSLCWGFHEKRSVFICTWLFLMQSQSKYGRFTFRQQLTWHIIMSQ
jgi:hypothetical protein